MSVDHCDDAMSGMDSSGCRAGVRVIVDSRHAGVGSCRRHVATGGTGCPTESPCDVVAHYCHLAAFEVMAILFLFVGVVFLKDAVVYT